MIFTYPFSAEVTSRSSSVVLSIVKQFLHHVAHMSMSSGFCSREASAKEVCMRCPVRTECAAHALAVREPYGVWGGLTEDEREELMGRSRNRLAEVPLTMPTTIRR